ncbi:MAG: bifunctional phosphopantothenoylcysteine decarboxylase/phosphopantothenate--cysteine ligase CoaBC [Fimbriimonadaceae bacterium]
MRKVVLGVCGSVAAYRAADLARELMRAGCSVRVCLTDSAQKFVTPALFEALTGNPCLIDTFEEPEVGRMVHIDWAREADLVVVAPATANTINKIAAGFADDLLTTMLLAYDGPLVVAPAMNPTMYQNETVQASLRQLVERGVFVIEPTEGDVACGENGQGKLASVGHLAQDVNSIMSRTQILAGMSVLITSGPTQEPMDDVRYLSNRSSGKMGAALARAALLLGANVTVITGPTAVSLPLAATVIRVNTAEEMLTAAQANLAAKDWIIGAAAVADYRPAKPFAGKMRRSSDDLTIELAPNPDIIATLAKLANPKQRVVGFAAEPTGDTSIAREKIQRKGLYAIAANDVSRMDIGFGADQNELVLIRADGSSSSSGTRSKLQVALWLFEELVG